jgi:SAM-dependent methyltransferase
MYHLSINSDNGPLSVKWKNLDILSYYATLQSGLFGGLCQEISRESFLENSRTWFQWQWDINANLKVYDLPENSRILDIGSGIGIMDLLAYSYIPQSQFYLLDAEDNNFQPDIYYDQNYPIYNTWSCLDDAINSTNFDRSRISTLSLDSNWPELDCITSYYSWCFHYPKETYWTKCLNNLRVGGKLALDVRNLTNRNLVEEISDEFKSKPETFEYINTLPDWIDGYSNDKVLGYRCVWTRNC